MADTGAGASLVLADSGSVGTIRKITLPELAMEALEVVDLSSTDYIHKVPSDLADPGEMQVEVLFDGENGVAPSLGAHELATVTFPKTVATATAATFAGTGFLRSNQLPELAVGELQVQTLAFTLDGGYNSGTVPTFTAQT